MRLREGYLSLRWILVLIAVIAQAIVFVAWFTPFPLPKEQAWQAFALLMFMASFLP